MLYKLWLLLNYYLLLAPYSLILNILLLTKPSQFELDSKVLLLVGNKKHSFFLLSASQLINFPIFFTNPPPPEHV